MRLLYTTILAAALGLCGCGGDERIVDAAPKPIDGPPTPDATPPIDAPPQVIDAKIVDAAPGTPDARVADATTTD